MQLKQFALFSIIIAIVHVPVFATVFVVTTNADNGPGSLRNAITQANGNGTATTDYIHFSIADITIGGRTIGLDQDLPALTSNIVIDGSTQPGTKIGISDAKIRLSSNTISMNKQGFIIAGGSNIEIYGMHFHSLGTPTLFGGVAICIIKAENLFIGAPGKGNYFSSVLAAVSGGLYFSDYAARADCMGFTFRSNIVNLTEDGNDISYTYMYPIVLRNAFNVQIGGESDAEGNFISCRLQNSILIEIDTLANVNTGFTKINNNKFGCNYQQNLALKTGAIYLRNFARYGYSDVANIEFKNNTLNSGGGGVLNYGLRVANRKGFVDVRSNKINNLLTGLMVLYSSVSNGISIYDCDDGIVGGPDPQDANVINACFQSAVASVNNKHVTISQNSIFCNRMGIIANSTLVDVPKTQIFTVTGNTVSGTTSLPNCKVEVFRTTACLGCHNGEIYLGSAMSDALGNWTFNGTIDESSAITATATTTVGVTGEFAKPEFRIPISTFAPTCNKTIGEIKGTQFISGSDYYWLKNRADTMFKQLDLTSLSSGRYEFHVEQGEGCQAVHTVTLSDESPKIYTNSMGVRHPTCGLANGSVDYLYTSGRYNKLFWKDAGGNVVTNSLSLLAVPPGKYKVFALDTINNCGDSTDWITLTNLSGPAVSLDNLQIKAATCQNEDGGITGLTTINVTGTATIIWLDSLNKVVGNTLDLLNVSAGKYKLKFKDQSTCDTIITSYYSIPSNGAITMDISQLRITPSQCAYPSGTIKGIGFTNAVDYDWTDASGNISTSFDPGFLNPGKYVITAKNTTGCFKRSDTINIPVENPMIFTDPLRTNSRTGLCDSLNGFVRLLNFPNSGDYTFKWIDSLQPSKIVSTSMNLENIHSGIFILNARSTAGCEQRVLVAILAVQSSPKLNESNISIVDEVCDNKFGKISGLFVETNSGLAPLQYRWFDADNRLIGTSATVQSLSAGTYKLVVTDVLGCDDTSQNFTVKNNTVLPKSPVYNDQSIRIHSTAILKVQNPQPGIYQLFESPSANIVLQENAQGIFTIADLLADKIFYIRFRQGSCVSNITSVKVMVYDQSGVYVPNAFTPNNDGKNDLLKVKVFGPVKLEYFKIYNRWGQLIFSTNELNEGWNGAIQGILHQTSVFVWLVRAKDELTGEVFEKKGTVTLIR